MRHATCFAKYQMVNSKRQLLIGQPNQHVGTRLLHLYLPIHVSTLLIYYVGHPRIPRSQFLRTQTMNQTRYVIPERNGEYHQYLSGGSLHCHLLSLLAPTQISYQRPRTSQQLPSATEISAPRPNLRPRSILFEKQSPKTGISQPSNNNTRRWAAHSPPYPSARKSFARSSLRI